MLGIASHNVGIKCSSTNEAVETLEEELISVQSKKFVGKVVQHQWLLVKNTNTSFYKLVVILVRLCWYLSCKIQMAKLSSQSKELTAGKFCQNSNLSENFAHYFFICPSSYASQYRLSEFMENRFLFSILITSQQFYLEATYISIFPTVSVKLKRVSGSVSVTLNLCSQLSIFQVF